MWELNLDIQYCLIGSLTGRQRHRATPTCMRSWGDSHHAPDGLLYVGVQRVLEHSLKQQGVFGDPLVGLGLHVPQTHAATLRVGLHPLHTQDPRVNVKVANGILTMHIESIVSRFLMAIH